jgi:ATP-binding cassette subfamily F protein 3
MAISISFSDIRKSFGTDVVLDGVSFSAEAGDKVGIIGRNGAGKSTLLRILTGEEEADSGNVFFGKDLRVGFLKQEQKWDESEFLSLRAERGNPTPLSIMKSAYEEAKAEGAEVFESEVVGLLRRMAFTDDMHEQPVSRFSGGESTRLAFAALLLRKPDILLLDEPTNHLDIGMLNWLEQHLRSFKGTVLLVTHDRYFLDRTVSKIVEIENHELLSYKGSYSQFAEFKREQHDAQMHAYEKAAREKRRQEDIIRHMKERGTEHLAKRAASREKRLAHEQVVQKPQSHVKSMRFGITEQTKSGNDVLLLSDIAKSFGNRELFNSVTLDVKRGERICMVGANGIGKTTLLEIILGRIMPNDGTIRKGQNVRLGYYDQKQSFDVATPSGFNRTVIEEMCSRYPKYSEGEMRNILATFLFTGDMVFREIDDLSGGERAKLALVRMILSDSNTLLLDEPTNHLDIPSREAVEDALLDFPGTLIVISHDRYFLNKVPTRIVELTEAGLLSFPGKYDYYQEKREQTISGAKYLKSLTHSTPTSSCAKQSEVTGTIAADNLEEPQLTDAATQRKRNKELETQKRRKESQIAAAEARITELEAEIAGTEQKLTEEKVATNPTILLELTNSLAKLHEDLEATLEKWESLHS